MEAINQISPDVAEYSGYTDLNGQFISFTTAEEVFTRARAVGARVLLRLELDDNEELTGMFYTNDRNLSG